MCKKINTQEILATLNDANAKFEELESVKLYNKKVQDYLYAKAAALRKEANELVKLAKGMSVHVPTVADKPVLVLKENETVEQAKARINGEPKPKRVYNLTPEQRAMRAEQCRKMREMKAEQKAKREMLMQAVNE